MKKSSRTGIVLALAMTMASSFMVWEENSKPGLPFGLQTAQASITGSAASPKTVHDRSVAMKHKLLLNRQRSALIFRVRQQLLDAAPASNPK